MPPKDDQQVNVIIRSFEPDRDQAFIYASWRNSAFYGARDRAKVPATFYHATTVLIRDTLKTAAVKIACVEDAPECILGYSVATGSHLHWIYVKLEFRCRGIGTALMPKGIETVTPDLTRIGAVLVKKKNLKIQGESNEQAEQGTNPTTKPTSD